MRSGLARRTPGCPSWAPGFLRRFDADQNGAEQTLLYYYDGPNVIAEHNLDGSVARRYVHGTNRINERAILIDGEYPTVDTYYYMLRELDTVAGLVAKNGTLVEAYDYDAYGQIRIWGYRPIDFDRDGDLDITGTPNDLATFMEGHLSSPPLHPIGDPSMDGVCDIVDYTYFTWYGTDPGGLDSRRNLDRGKGVAT